MVNDKKQYKCIDKNLYMDSLEIIFPKFFKTYLENTKEFLKEDIDNIIKFISNKDNWNIGKDVCFLKICKNKIGEELFKKFLDLKYMWDKYLITYPYKFNLPKSILNEQMLLIFRKSDATNLVLVLDSYIKTYKVNNAGIELSFKVLNIYTNGIDIKRRNEMDNKNFYEVTHTETGDIYLFDRDTKMVYKKEDYLSNDKLKQIIKPINKEEKSRIVKHFKGKLYLILDVGLGIDDKYYMVYKALYGDFKLYIRPYEMFKSKVDRGKYPDVKQEYRFEDYQK